MHGKWMTGTEDSLPLHWFSANLKKCFLCHCLRPQHQSCSYFLPLCSPYHLHLQEIFVTAWRISKIINNKVKIKTWASAIERHFGNVCGMLSDHAFPCFKVNIGEDTWGEKHFSGEVAGVTATNEGNFCEILCSAQVGSSIDWKTDTVIGAGY